MNQAEAEFVQGMLLEEGIPSTLRRTRGFDVPDMLAAGPRDVMVPASGHGAAREVLLEAEIVNDDPVEETPPCGCWRCCWGSSPLARSSSGWARNSAADQPAAVSIRIRTGESAWGGVQPGGAQPAR